MSRFAARVREECVLMDASVSIIIPVHDGREFLERGLAALEREHARERLTEVLVVDDGSSDGSGEAAATFGVEVVRLDSRGGPAAARNEGAKIARGEWLWFLDADVEVNAESLDQVEAFVRDPGGADAAVGSYDLEPSHPGLCSQFKNLFHHYVHQQAGETISSFWAGCGLVKKAVFVRAGGFDAAQWPEPSIEDIELGYRMTREGTKIRVLPELTVKHHKAWTLGGLIRTDVLLRGAPWTVLLLSGRSPGQTELNLGWSYRLSIILVYLGLVFLMLAARWLPSLYLALACLVLVTGLSFRLLKFFAEVRGVSFALRTVPLLWLYYFYSGIGFLIGLAQFLVGRLTGSNRGASLATRADRSAQQ